MHDIDMIRDRWGVDWYRGRVRGGLGLLLILLGLWNRCGSVSRNRRGGRRRRILGLVGRLRTLRTSLGCGILFPVAGRAGTSGSSPPSCGSSIGSGTSILCCFLLWSSPAWNRSTRKWASGIIWWPGTRKYRGWPILLLQWWWRAEVSAWSPLSWVKRSILLNVGAKGDDADAGDEEVI